jgi:hypothetical protein
LYRYVFNEPFRFVDPSGLDAASGTIVSTIGTTGAIEGSGIIAGIGAGIVVVGSSIVAYLGVQLGYESMRYYSESCRAARLEAQRRVIIENMAKGATRIANDYLDQLRRKYPKATKEELCNILKAAYEAARKAGDSKLANTIKLAQKALGCRQTHYGRKE